jgi:nucleoside-diphosphate-sugar epimerase
LFRRPSPVHFFSAEERGAQVSGTTRSPARAEALRSLGLDVVASEDGDEGGDFRSFVASRVQQATHVLSTAGPDRDGGDPFLAAHAASLAGAPHLTWTSYLSSTSAYGEHDGRWVSEETAPVAPGAKGAARLEAEQAWTSAAAATSPSGDARLCIMRLAGIYGPGRSALDTLLRRPVAPPASAPAGDADAAPKLTSRVHVDDIIAALFAAAGSAGARGVYNVADDAPASRGEVFEYARKLLRGGAAGTACRGRLESLERLAAGGAGPAASSTRRDAERASKRVANGRLRDELGVDLQFPSYREGLASIAASYAAVDKEV